MGFIMVDTTLLWGEVSVPKPPTAHLGALCRPGETEASPGGHPALLQGVMGHTSSKSER